MKARDQLAKLRKEMGASRTDADVMAISLLMDELGAAAAGGLNPERMTLEDYFESQPQPQTNPE